MKKIISLLTILIVNYALQSQNVYNPYASIGKKKPKVATVTNGAYDELYIKDSLVLINNNAISRKTGDIVFSKKDNPNIIAELIKKEEDKFRFLSIDPLASTYPYLSPYSFCNNNPIWFKEIDGRYFDFSNLTAEQRNDYEAQIKTLRESKLFDYVYKQLESSSSKFVVNYGKTGGTNPAEFRPNKDYHGGEIIYDPTKSQSNNAVLEENFHAFQLDNKENFYPNVSVSNIEFEAKLFNHMALFEAGLPMPTQSGTEDFTTNLLEKYDYNNPTSAQLKTEDFQTTFSEGVQTFVNTYKKIVPDPKVFPGYKAAPSPTGPNAVIKAQQEVEASNAVGPRLQNGDFYAK